MVGSLLFEGSLGGTKRGDMVARAASLVVIGFAALLSAAPLAPVHAQERSGLSGPTQQLFDAVRRKDLGAAQAAVGAGADIEARNGLGLRAVDMAVDLGNFDIAHYLLAVSSAKTRPAVEDAAARPTSAPSAAPSAGLSAPLIGADGVPAASPVIPVKQDQIGGTKAAPGRASAAAPRASRPERQLVESATAAARQEAPSPPPGPNPFDAHSQPPSFALPIVDPVREPGRKAPAPAAASASSSVPAAQSAPAPAASPDARPSGSARQSQANDGPGLLDWFGGLFRKSDKPAASLPAEGAQAEPAGAPASPLVAEAPRPRDPVVASAQMAAASDPATEASGLVTAAGPSPDPRPAATPLDWLIGFGQPLLPPTEVGRERTAAPAPAAVEPPVVAVPTNSERAQTANPASLPGPIDWLVALWRSSSSVSANGVDEVRAAHPAEPADREAIAERPEPDRQEDVASVAVPPQPSAEAARTEAAAPAPASTPVASAEPVPSHAVEEIQPEAAAPSPTDANEGPDLLARVAGFFKAAFAPTPPPETVVALAAAETLPSPVPTSETPGLAPVGAAPAAAVGPEAPGFFSRLTAFFASPPRSAPASAALPEAPAASSRIEVAAMGSAPLAAITGAGPSTAITPAEVSRAALDGADRPLASFEPDPGRSFPLPVAGTSFTKGDPLPTDAVAKPKSPQVAAAPKLLPTPIPAAEPKPGFLDRLGALFRGKPGGEKPEADRSVAALSPQRHEIPPPPPPHFVEAADLSIGDSLRLGRSRAEARAADTGCIEKRSWDVWFCVEPVDWPASIAQAFDASSTLYRGAQAIARYDGGVATQYHAVFPAENFAAVVAHFTKILGTPTEKPEIRTAMIGAPARLNAAFRWEAPESDGNQILEVRQIDDLRWVMPDTQFGVVRLYREGAESVFTLLSISDLQLSRLRRPTGG